jgi:hypothetical protein
MRFLPCLFLLLCTGYAAMAQSPLVKQWDARYGGNLYEFLVSFQPTSDGGFIAGSRTSSDSSGDKTQPGWGGEDYWIVKLDANGQKQWDKRFGGTDHEWFACVKQTPDGGYILGGGTSSHNDGDVSEDTRDTPPNTTFDYWIVKTDAQGNKQWDRRYGGNSYDLFQSLDLTADGGYILGGHSISDSSGDKTQPKRGGYDYWIVKIDTAGNKQWDKRFGGSAHDQLSFVKQTLDGGYILGGEAVSSGNGDISPTLPFGGSNYWVVKTDALGNKEWDRLYGGTNVDVLFDVIQTADQGFVLCGSSISNADGNKSHPNLGVYNNTADCWLVKIDAAGNKQWDRVYGGSGNEGVPSIIKTTDGGYLITCESSSPAGFDKTENNTAESHAWMLKLDSAFNRQWDKTILTDTGFIHGTFTVQSGHCYATAVSTDAQVGGYKTQTNRGLTDVWAIMFCDTTAVTGIIESNTQIAIYPNPFTTQLQVKLLGVTNGSATFKIMNALGQIVFSETEVYSGTSYVKTIPVSFLSSGFYIAEVTTWAERKRMQMVKQ